MTFTLNDILVVLSELTVTLFIVLGLWWINRLVFNQLKRFPWLAPHKTLLAVGFRGISYLLLIFWSISSLLIIGINIVLLKQGKSLPAETIKLITQLSPQTWASLGQNLLTSMLILTLAAGVQTPLSKGLDITSRWLQNLDRFTENDLSIDQFFKSLKLHLSHIIWLVAILLSSQTFKLEIIANYLFIGLKVYLAIASGLLTIKISDAIIDSLDAWSTDYISDHVILKPYTQLRSLVPFLKRVLEYGIYLGVATLAFAQIEALLSLAEVGTKAIKVLGIVLASRILVEVSALIVAEFLMDKKNLGESQYKRRMTLVPILQSVLKYGIYLWSGLFILNAIEIDPTPILAAAGVLGLAVGLGAQSLINDAVSGFFILFENYYLVGDYIEVKGVEGVVEAIELRTTHIRHPNGQLQILRNGDIDSIINFSREYIYAVVDVGVAYDSDLNQVFRVIETVGLDIQEMFPQDVLEPTKVDGLEAFGDYKLIVRTITKLKPNNSRRGVHDDMQAELRKMIKESFDREGIVIPTPKTIGILADSEEE